MRWGDRFAPRYFTPDGRPMTLEQWAGAYGRFDPHIGETILTLRGKRYRVSTVWLGLDHGWMSDRPLIFETMIFEGRTFTEAGYQWRYSTSEQAIRGHMRAVRFLKRIVRTEPRPKQLIHNGHKPTGRWSTNCKREN